MKKFFILLLLLTSACTHLTAVERNTLRELKTQGIDIDHPNSNWEKPASPVSAGLLNLLPGVGNFYLASGNGAQSEHVLYGTLNLLTWPISILWGVPEAAIDANVINQRELIYHYTYERTNKKTKNYYR
ncbi:MAG: hypothetical protein IJZ30_00180 [Alphaproteobacteria bacterium]|nr:hypothetical protein [Alphaproteobacteria bacterium]